MKVRLVTPEEKPRKGWEELFRAAHDDSSDELLLEPLPPNAFDREEWTW